MTDFDLSLVEKLASQKGIVRWQTGKAETGGYGCWRCEKRLNKGVIVVTGRKGYTARFFCYRCSKATNDQDRWDSYTLKGDK